MNYLVDTDRVASFLNGQPAATLLLTTLAPRGLAISLITYGETYEGIYGGRDPADAERAFRRFLRAVDVLPLNRSIMRRFARVRRDLRRQGRLIPDPDLLIGATALHHGLTLVTGNRAHFERIPGLVIDPRWSTDPFPPADAT